MSGPFHERAICECGWSTPCSFGDLYHLTHHGRHINVCPDCGKPKGRMKIKVLRWHEGTWRDSEGTPFDGIEPAAPTPASRTTAVLLLLAILLLFACLVWALS